MHSRYLYIDEYHQQLIPELNNILSSINTFCAWERYFGEWVIEIHIYMHVHINKLDFILLFPKVKAYKQGIKLKLFSFGMIYALIFTCP